MLRRRGASRGARRGRRACAYAERTGAPEDAASRRVARPGGTSSRAERDSSTGTSVGVGEAGGDKDTPRFEVDAANAVLDHRQREPGIELENVVGDTRGHGRHLSE